MHSRRRRGGIIVAVTGSGRGNRSGHLTNDPSATYLCASEQELAARPTGSRGNSMPKVLFADNDFSDLDLERKLFAAAGAEFATAQCKSEDDVIAAARDCAAILLQYA